MKILVLNAGSSSLKCDYFVGGVGQKSLLIERISDMHQTLLEIESLLPISSFDEVDAIGHRVVHGGDEFTCATRITPSVIEGIRSLIPLAPLHNPANLDGIEIMAKKHPDLVQFAVFDTAFHQSMPEYASFYPLPYEWREKWNIRRYGFHGISCGYVCSEASKKMQKPLPSLNLIVLHLGNGASVTAIEGGRSIDTSMGFTPLAGLMMGTRCGDIDVAILPYLMRISGMSLEEIERTLNQESGLLGICGASDMREVMAKADQKESQALLALEMYIYSIAKTIGAYTVALGRVDGVIFTGGIGENASEIRERVCQRLEASMGLILDKDANQRASSSPKMIHKKQSRIEVWIIPTNEALEIAKQIENLVQK